MLRLLQDLSLETPTPTSVIVRWDAPVAGHGAEIDIRLGERADTASQRSVARVAATVGELHLDGLAPGPRFASLSPAGTDMWQVVGERRIALEGLENLRDIGGYENRDGHFTRWGTLYRADSLHKLTAHDHDVLDARDIHQVYDLRGDTEREEHPNPRPSTQLAVVGHPQTTRSTGGDMSHIENGESLLRDVYVGALVYSAPLFGRLFRELATDATPAVFHCHAGKDRTGVVAALLLLTAGVDETTVLDDYELTSQYRSAPHETDSYANMIEKGMSVEAAVGVLATPRWAMAEMLASLHDNHGGIERYLRDGLSLTEAEIAALKLRLVL